MAGRASVLTQSLSTSTGKSVVTSPTIKAEAAAVVATAQRERNERIAAQKVVKTASPKEIQALINAMLSAR